MLFSGRSIWTMAHGIGLGGAALIGLSASLFYLYAARAPEGSGDEPAGSRALAGLMVATAAMLWLTVLVGTYIIFPLYRAVPPGGAADLGAFPRALVMSRPDTAWLHSLAMESKEHMPWIASMLATAVAFVAVRYRSRVLRDSPLRDMAIRFLATSFALVVLASLLGVFVNKVAPLQ